MRTVNMLLLFVSALVLVDTVFFTALTPLLPRYTPETRHGSREPPHSRGAYQALPLSHISGQRAGLGASGTGKASSASPRRRGPGATDVMLILARFLPALLADMSHPGACAARLSAESDDREGPTRMQGLTAGPRCHGSMPMTEPASQILPRLARFHR